MNKDELSGFLIAIGSLLSEMTDEDFRSMLKGQGKLSFSSFSKSSKSREEPREASINLSIIANKLDEFVNREEAVKFLTDNNILKNDLVKLASHLDIFINKSDSKEKIIEKIVEATVGVMMRSKAIQDTQLKHSTKKTSD